MARGEPKLERTRWYFRGIGSVPQNITNCEIQINCKTFQSRLGDFPSARSSDMRKFWLQIPLFLPYCVPFLPNFAYRRSPNGAQSKAQGRFHGVFISIFNPFSFITNSFYLASRYTHVTTTLESEGQKFCHLRSHQRPGGFQVDEIMIKFLF